MRVTCNAGENDTYHRWKEEESNAFSEPLSKAAKYDDDGAPHVSSSSTRLPAAMLRKPLHVPREGPPESDIASGMPYGNGHMGTKSEGQMHASGMHFESESEGDACNLDSSSETASLTRHHQASNHSGHHNLAFDRAQELSYFGETRGCTKAEAASYFQILLKMATKGVICVEQIKPYSDITALLLPQKSTFMASAQTPPKEHANRARHSLKKTGFHLIEQVKSQADSASALLADCNFLFGDIEAQIELKRVGNERAGNEAVWIHSPEANLAGFTMISKREHVVHREKGQLPNDTSQLQGRTRSVDTVTSTSPCVSAPGRSDYPTTSSSSTIKYNLSEAGVACFTGTAAQHNYTPAPPTREAFMQAIRSEQDAEFMACGEFSPWPPGQTVDYWDSAAANLPAFATLRKRMNNPVVRHPIKRPKPRSLVEQTDAAAEVDDAVVLMAGQQENQPRQHKWVCRAVLCCAVLTIVCDMPCRDVPCRAVMCYLPLSVLC